MDRTKTTRFHHLNFLSFVPSFSGKTLTYNFPASSIGIAAAVHIIPDGGADAATLEARDLGLGEDDIYAQDILGQSCVLFCVFPPVIYFATDVSCLFGVLVCNTRLNPLPPSPQENVAAKTM